MGRPGAQPESAFSGGNMSKVTINTPAPDFELADINGKPVRLSDLRGRNVLLVFNRGFA
jgi:peroxiredoxin